MTTLAALARREANPPLKSPLPQKREAAKTRENGNEELSSSTSTL